MPVTVRIPAPLRPLAGGASAVECVPGTVRELIDQLDAQYAGFRDRVMEDGALRRFVNVFVAGEDVSFGDGNETGATEGQEGTNLPADAEAEALAGHENDVEPPKLALQHTRELTRQAQTSQAGF